MCARSLSFPDKNHVKSLYFKIQEDPPPGPDHCQGDYEVESDDGTSQSLLVNIVPTAVSFLQTKKNFEFYNKGCE